MPTNIDSNVPMGPGWFDFVLEDHGLSGNEVKKLYDSDSDFAEIENPVQTLFNKYAANRFDKSAGNHSDSAWDEPLGAAVVVKKYSVGGETLGKGEVTSRMLGLLNQIRPFCEGKEAEQIERAIKCLDFSLFGELAEPVLARMKS